MNWREVRYEIYDWYRYIHAGITDAFCMPFRVFVLLGVRRIFGYNKKDSDSCGSCIVGRVLCADTEVWIWDLDMDRFWILCCDVLYLF